MVDPVVFNLDPAFKEGEEIECKHGRGVVTYCEDGFMEVRLKDGTERTFNAPFLGKISRYSKPMQVHELPVWTEIAEHPALAPHWKAVEAYHSQTTALLGLVGASGTPWEGLADFNRCNFLAVFSGCPIEFWKKAAEANCLDAHAAVWLASGRKTS